MFFHSSEPSTTLFNILILRGKGKGHFSSKDWLLLELCQYQFPRTAGEGGLDREAA